MVPSHPIPEPDAKRTLEGHNT